eukprot:g7591.t2
MSNKRPRIQAQHQQRAPPPQQRLQPGHGHHRHRHDGWEEEGDNTGCVCSNAACPWSFRSSSSSRSSRSSRSSSSSGGDSSRASSTKGAAGSTNGPLSPAPSDVEPSDDDDNEDSMVPPWQFFDGPLLSVKEYRDQPTGEVRFAVFQGDRRMSVAQILFSLKRGEDDHAYGHVKSVSVHRDFRGMGLGPLLFKELYLQTLTNTASTKHSSHETRAVLGVFATLGNLSVTEVRLEAEEDMCKYNRLIRYYESLGFRQLEGSKVRYVHHCDQVYRKIPMLRQVSAPLQPRFRRLPRLVDSGGWFLVVRLQTKTGSFVRSTASGDVVSPHPGGAAAAAVADGGGGGGGGSCEVEGCCGGSGGPPAGGGAAPAGCDAAGGGVEGGRGNGATAAGNGCPSQQSGGGARSSDGRAKGANGDGSGERTRRGRGRDADDLWTLTVSEVRGVVCFESAYGKYLCVEPDGKVVADRSWDDSWEQFSLETFAPDLLAASPAPSSHPEDGAARASSTVEEKQAQEHLRGGDRGHRHGGTSSPDNSPQTTAPPLPHGTGADDCREGMNCDEGGSGGLGARVRGDGDAPLGGAQGRPPDVLLASSGSSLGATGRAVVRGGAPTSRFALRTYHGQYLSLDAEFGTVSTSAQPVLWSTDEKNSICHCEGAVPWAEPPPTSRRQVALRAHLRSMRQLQNVSFVTGTRKKYMDSFGRRGRFSVKAALDILDRHHDPLQPTRVSRLSFAGLLALTAQDIRDEGLPDWVQAVGLAHGLGRILHFLGEDAGITETERECVLGEYSWVVGAPFPDSITCASYNVDNDDAVDERYGAGGSKPTGMYEKGSGLENALLCFTGPEYMHMVLRNHGTGIPPQGLAMLRLYPLEPWHAGGCYADIESAADKDAKNAVRQFDAIRRATLHSITVRRREVNLERAWYEHLRDLADKYFPGDLAW